MGTVSGVGKSFAAEPVYKQEGQPPIKKRKTEQRKTLLNLPAELQAQIESYLDPKSASQLARSSQDLRKAHIDRILLVNPEVAGKLAILDENQIPQIWKEKLASIKSIVLPEPRDRIVPGPLGIPHLTFNCKDEDTSRHFANITRNTPQVQHIDLSNFVSSDINITPLCRLPNLKSIRSLDLWKHFAWCLVDGDARGTHPNLESLGMVNACSLTDSAIRELFKNPLKALSIEYINTSTALLELAKHGDVVTGLTLLISVKGITHDDVQKIGKSFPNLTRLSIVIRGKPDQEMVKALDNWLTKENLPKLQTVAITVELDDSLKVPFTVNLLEKPFASAAEVLNSL